MTSSSSSTSSTNVNKIWYFVDGSGNTQGPLTVAAMKNKFIDGELSMESYIWNGTSVNQLHSRRRLKTTTITAIAIAMAIAQEEKSNGTSTEIRFQSCIIHVQC